MREQLVGLRQPDRRSCGAACLVVARMLTEPAYAATITPDAFASEVLALHRRITSTRDSRGARQAPWPRAVGTPPWAVARHLAGLLSAPCRTRAVRAGGRAFDLLADSAHPAALYVGSRWLPRHVVLVLGTEADALQCYEPSRGEVVTVPRSRFDGRLDLAGWRHPWFVVTPR